MKKAMTSETQEKRVYELKEEVIGNLSRLLVYLKTKEIKKWLRDYLRTKW